MSTYFLPALTDPALTDPALTDPALTDPALTDPALTDPALTDPALTDPARTLTPEAEPVAGELATMAFLVVFRLLINDFFWMVMARSSMS